ncbi:MAG TPA: NAD(P)-dependent oxidoreductase [Solirubrobacterales bacterium]|nr:NAD(P)-dependent oxidoreductase [Solirubrobacterales bacterium]
MKVFIAGASGALGRPLVAQLVAAGHEVTGMTRREERAAAIREAGAEAVVCDVFDATALNEAVAAAAPEVVVHALTALPPSFKPKEDYLAATNRVRTEGTRNLVAAAQAAGARRLIAESVAFFYEPEGEWVKDEEARLMVEAPGRFAAGRDALVELEQRVTGAEGLEGLVLRFGWLYGPGTYYAADGSMAAETRRRRNPVIGAGTGRFSFVHVDDAAAAIVAALDRGAPGAYNVVDDEPAEQREWLPVYAEALGAKPPRRVPVWLARLAAGADLASTAVTMRGASNAKAKRELGWEPAHPSWRTGFAESLSDA